MRVLVACEKCRRQYDAGHLPVGSRFRCRCGAVVQVSNVIARDAAVVRCSSCGGPRSDGAASCPYCGADFTLREQDMETLCPACMARVSNRARFCHNCGTPIVPEGTAGEATELPCPVCGPEHILRSRSVGESGQPFMECSRCAGIWLGQESFRLLLDRVRKEIKPDRAEGNPARRAGTPSRNDGRPARYRRCPICGDFMLRQNYGRRSGVILDSCKKHGIWFDAQELEGVVAWIRGGGEQVAAKLAAEEVREDACSRFVRQQIDRYAGNASGRPSSEAEIKGTALGDLLTVLFDL